MTLNPIAAAALGYGGERKERREATGPMTRFGRDVPNAAQCREQRAVTPERP